MSELSSFELISAAAPGQAVALPEELRRLYGTFTLPQRVGRPVIVGNFVTTLDGVVTLNIPGQSGGGPISGFNRHDRLVMGLLRAAADAIIVGAGTLRAVPQHRWTAAYIFPALAAAYQSLRSGLGKAGPPWTVLVTASGRLDLSLPVFQSGDAPVLIVTTERGAAALRGAPVPADVEVVSASAASRLSADDILSAVTRRLSLELVLTEGGPLLIGDFLAGRALDQLFLTIAPQIVGRKQGDGRAGLVEGRHFAPDSPRWGQLVEVRRAESHLFLRYAFARGTDGA